MDKLYAPWRERYVHQAIRGQRDGACVFCEVFDGAEADEQRLVLWKDQDLAILLNLYPYNGGHLLIIPRVHVAEFNMLSNDILGRMMVLVSQSITLLQQVLGCQGINFGANVGKAAGAGIPDHLHMHVVPRFAGDTNFFTTVGNTKQISVDLESIYKKLKPYFDTQIVGNV